MKLEKVDELKFQTPKAAKIGAYFPQIDMNQVKSEGDSHRAEKEPDESASSRFSKATSSLKDHYDVMKGLICGFLAATSAALSIILIKLLLIQTKINEFELIYQRSLIACLSLCLILYLNDISPFSIPRDVSRFAFQRVFGSFFGFMLEIFALDFIPSSKAVLIVNNPFLTSILSYLLIGEVSSKHDMISFLVCTLGVSLLTDPFNDSAPSSDTEYIGIILAVLSSISFNLSYLALRNLKGHQINSWILVFHIMIVNLMFMPTCFLSYDLVYRHSFT